MKITITPTYDSDNRNPPEVEVSSSRDGNVMFSFQWMERRVTFNINDLEKVVKIFKED